MDLVLPDAAVHVANVFVVCEQLNVMLKSYIVFYWPTCPRLMDSWVMLGLDELSAKENGMEEDVK